METKSNIEQLIAAAICGSREIMDNINIGTSTIHSNSEIEHTNAEAKVPQVTIKRRALALEDKVNVIRMIENGRKKAEVCRMLGLANSTVQTIWKNKLRIIAAYEKNGPNIKRLRKPERKDVDDALLQWFKQKRSDNLPVTRAMLKEKAEEFAKIFNDKNFVCTTGWIDRFKLRHKISYLKENDEPCKTLKFKEEINVDDNKDHILAGWMRNFDPNDMDSYININDYVSTIDDRPGESTSRKSASESEQDEDDDEEVEDDNQQIVITPPNIIEALEAIRTVYRFYEATSQDSELFIFISKIEDDLEKQFWANRMQMKIKDFFA